jgi:fructose 1,6-bisphosphate aldolase/phosphatase
LQLKLYAAGQDLLKDAFSGNVRGMGPGVAEMEIEERTSDPIVVFAADKTSAGSFNYPLFRMFADPMNTAGLVIDPNMLCGFKFEVIDTLEDKAATIQCPTEMYELLALIGTVGRYAISRVWRASDDLICASSSVSKLSLIAGKYVGKDDPVMIARAQHGLPAVGEILAPFMHSYFVQGWMRGSHWGPLMRHPSAQRLTARLELLLWASRLPTAKSQVTMMINRLSLICSMTQLSLWQDMKRLVMAQCCGGWASLNQHVSALKRWSTLQFSKS